MKTNLELMKIALEEKKNLLLGEDYQDVNEPSTKDLIERVKRLEEKMAKNEIDSVKEDIERLNELQDICFAVTFSSEYVKVEDILKQYLISGKGNKKFSEETEAILKRLFNYFSENNLIIEYYKSFQTTPDLYEILGKTVEMI